MNNQTEVGTQQGTNEKRKKKRWIILVLILLLLLGLAAGYIYQMSKVEPMSRLARDEMALGGLLPGKTPEEISSLLNDKMEEGMVSIGVSAEPIFEYNGKKGRLGIENVPANQYSFQVKLLLEDGTELYESGLIDPGFYIEYVELNRTLQAGDYNATVVFTTYSLDETEDQIAEAQVNIVLHVTDGKFYQ